MVFTDQMLQPRRILPVPKDLAPPRVNLNVSVDGGDHHPTIANDGLPSSPLGVWYLDGCETFLEIAQTILDPDTDLYDKIAHLVQTRALSSSGNYTEARGRRNINLKAVPPPTNTSSSADDSDASSREEIIMLQRLQVEAANIAKHVSRRMEVWLNLPSGSMERAHDKGMSSSLRLLHYPPGVEVPPHTDGSAYTIVYNNSNMIIQSPDNDDLWYELVVVPPKNNNTNHQLLLMLGSHLDQAIPARLQQIGCNENNNNNILLRAPVHRLNASDTIRRALTLHIKADSVWPCALEDLNQSNHKKPSEGILTAAHYHDRDISWDAELFSQYLYAKYVPSVQHVQDHLQLLISIVEGCESIISDCDDSLCSSSSSCSSSAVDAKNPADRADDSNMGNSFVYRLPSVHCTRYWQLQTERYCTFLRIHQKYSSQAVGILPPREIHHVWLCHQLHPICYKADCEKLYGRGRILDHNNNNFCLRGSPAFHELWEAETGVPWPSRADLRREAETAEDSPTEVMVLPPKDNEMISANLWHNYDGLALLYCELRKESPCLFMFDSKDALFSLLNQARLDYARFLIAASYASTVGMTVTPSGPVDLVWHTHQTNPHAYNDTIQKEFPTAPIDHVPCGALNPPPENGKEWLEMTDKIWTELYGHGVNVQGRAIHCCTPTNARPRRLVVSSSSENVEVAWFIDPNGEYTEFPATRSAVVQLESLLSANNLDVDDLFNNIFQPMSVAIVGAFQSRKERMGRKFLRFLRYMFLFFGSLIAFLVAMASAERLPPSFTRQRGAVDWDATSLWIKFLISFSIGGMCGGVWCCCLVYCLDDNDIGKSICLIVDSYKSQAMERGICMRYLSKHVGPVDAANPGNNLYQGNAIVFRRCNQPVIEESPFVSVANEEEAIPTVAAVAADAYAVDHRDQERFVEL